MQFKVRHISAAVTSVLIAACGGGGGGDNATRGTPTSGKAVDGYLSFARVVCDLNNNGSAEDGEPATYTDIKGNFVFATGCKQGLIASGGTSLDTGLEFVGQLRAPAGATVVTPLTTLVASGMTHAQVATALALPTGTNVLTTDPAATDSQGALLDASLMKKTLVMQQLLQKSTELFTGLGGVTGSVAINTVYLESAAAFASTLKTTALIDNSGVVSGSMVHTMLSTALTRLANSNAVSQDVKTKFNDAGGAEAIAAISAPALTSQAQVLANASTTDDITAKTKDRQSSTAITDNVIDAIASGELNETNSTNTALLQSLSERIKTAADQPAQKTTVASLPVYFDETVLPVISGFDGAEGSSITAGPTNGYGKALNVLRKGGQNYAGAIMTVSPIAFTESRKTITARVYSPKAGVPIKIKAEYASQRGTAEAAATTAVVQGWQTLTWVLSDVDLSKAYTGLVFLPDIGTVSPTSGDSYYFDNIELLGDSVVVPTNYLYLDSDSIGFSANGTTGSAVSYSMADFQSNTGGINIKWPMADAGAIKLKLKINGSFSFDPSQTLSAAVRIEETGGGKGEIRAYTDKVAISKSGDSITLSVPNLPQALIYSVSSTGQTKAVVDFASKVRGITNTLSTSSGAISTVMFGEVVNYAITGLSNQFNNMSAMRGKYKVTIVVNELPLRKADGSPFDSLTIEVPTTVSGGQAGNIVPVTGKGLVGYINLVD